MGGISLRSGLGGGARDGRAAVVEQTHEGLVGAALLLAVVLAGAAADAGAPRRGRKRMKEGRTGPPQDVFQRQNETPLLCREKGIILR